MRKAPARLVPDFTANSLLRIVIFVQNDHIIFHARDRSFCSTKGKRFHQNGKISKINKEVLMSNEKIIMFN